MITELLQTANRADDLVSAFHPTGPDDRQIHVFAVPTNCHDNTLDQEPHDRLVVLGLGTRGLPHGWEIGCHAADDLTVRRGQLGGMLTEELIVVVLNPTL